MKKILLLSIVITVVACSKKMSNTSSVSSANEPSAKPALSPEMAAGKYAYEKYCSACHGLKDPDSESASEWKEIVPEMSSMSKRKRGISIDKNTQQSILAYLVANAKK